jgi:hypothetical protein
MPYHFTDIHADDVYHESASPRTERLSVRRGELATDSGSGHTVARFCLKRQRNRTMSRD